MNDLQELHDTFYFRHGKCCAGCDWWRGVNSQAGECTRRAPVSGKDRIAPLGMSSASLNIGGGHILTKASHVCGDFEDKFDWATLPLAYRARIGCTKAKE